MSAHAHKPQDWSGLGFNPAPGAAHVVGNLAERLEKLASHLSDAHETMDRIAKGKKGSDWHGAAASAFREKAGKLPKYIQDASDSVAEAKGALKAWHRVLTENEPKAWDLEAQAKSARTHVAKAEVDYRSASANPDLDLAGTTYVDEVARANAQQRYNAAKAELDSVTSRLNSTRSHLDDLISQANVLAGDHEGVARSKAGVVRDAADNHAPPEDGFWSDVGDFFKNNADWFTVAASVVGIAAIFFPPLTIAAVALSAVALVSHGAKYGKEGLWPPSKDKLGNYLTLGGDLLGAVPGVGIAAKGIGVGARAARGAEGIFSATKVGIASGARELKFAATGLDPALPLITRPVESVAAKFGASSIRAQQIADGVQAGAMAAWTAPTAAYAAHPSDATGNAANWGTAIGNGFTGGGGGKLGGAVAAGSAVSLGLWEMWK